MGFGRVATYGAANFGPRRQKHILFFFLHTVLGIKKRTGAFLDISITSAWTAEEEKEESPRGERGKEPMSLSGTPGSGMDWAI